MNNLAEISFENAILSLKAKAAEFMNIYRNFMMQEPFAALDAKTYDKWKSTRAKIDTIKKSVSWITNVIDGASGFFSSTGLNGVASLSALPLVPVAAVVGATAALGFGINMMLETLRNIYDVKKRYEIVDSINQQREAQGLPPLTAVEVNKIVSTNSELETVAKWGLIAAALYFVVPVLWKKVNK